MRRWSSIERAAKRAVRAIKRTTKAVSEPSSTYSDIATRQLLHLVVYQSAMQHRFSEQSMISPNLVCLRPTSDIRMTSPGLLAPTACRVAIMIAAKNGAMTTATAAMTTGWKA